MDLPTSNATAQNWELEFGNRLVRLCDGRSGLRGALPAEVREPAPEPPASSEQAPAGPATAAASAPEATSHPTTGAVLDFLSSDATLDRTGEVVEPRGWRLEAYRRNPVFQNAHQYGDVLFTLGKALITEVRDRHLFQRIEFAVDANPVARIAYGLYRGRFLSAVSVGFIPLRWENGESTGRPAPGADTARNGRDSSSPANFRRRYLEQELLEVSAVGIPANPNALRLGLREGAITKGDLREVLELQREAETTLAITSDAVRSSWLPMARELGQVIRALLRRA